MARNPYTRKPLKVLASLAALVVVLGVLLMGANVWGTGMWVPKLGLDLEGGTQIVLEPKLVGDQKVTSDQLEQARGIIVQRIDSNGVSGAEVTTRGGTNIVVSMPGEPSKQDEDALRRSSQMQFRGVLAVAPGSPQATPTDTGTGTATGTPTGTATGTATTEGSEVPKATDSATTAKSAVPGAFVQSTTPPTTEATDSATTAKSAVPGAFVQSTTPPTTEATDTATGTETSGSDAKPQDPNDLAWITDDISKQFQELDCSKPDVLEGIVNDPAKPLVTCSTDGAEKYVLGPVIVNGDQIKDAQAGYQTLSNGQTSNVVEIALSFKSAGTKAYAEASKRMVGLESPRNQMAAVLDNQVIVAPYFQSAILDGNASITGSFTIESARDLANQLKFGALPMSFTLQTREQISPTLGTEQLKMGVIAGLIGLLLVGVYSLFQYRALGFVTLASIAIAALLTYLTITILGWSHNYRLDMAGVTGLVVAIGVTADSFIVYFERIRDEVREGRPLRAAVETGWRRARRTILVADGVNFIAALVLYFLASSGVRGFAFTLGLTTLIDILVVFMFTHPLVALLAETKFFGGGHKWSGLSPERLGAKVAPRYVGRGRFAAPAMPRVEGSTR